MLTTWQTHPDIQEAERALYAMLRTPDADLLRQALDFSLMNNAVLSRSPGARLGAVLRGAGGNPGSGGATGSDVAWQWVQDNFAAGNATKVLGALESLPFLPTQANLDRLGHFLELVPAESLPAIASKARLLARLHHQVTWVQQHLKHESDLCLRASELVSTELPATAG
ncbi:hypothetical protein ABBQ38_014505 [Trebouxia sp. C0009 RCD-2024]